MRALYEAERRLPYRTYASGHSFDEWRWYMFVYLGGC